MTLAQVLYEGFALAHRRVGLIFLDLLWKAVWLAVTLAGLLIVIGWFGAQLQSIQWQGLNVPAIDSLAVAAALREFWDAYKGQFFAATLGVGAISILVWFFLEAVFRSRALSPREKVAEGRVRAGTPSLHVFLASNAVKSIALAAAGIALCTVLFGSYLSTPFSEWPGLWLDTRAAAVAGLVAFAAFAFLLTTIDTLIRSDAVELLATDLLHVAGLMAILLLLETTIAASLAIAVVAGFLNVAGRTEAVIMFGLVFLALVFLNLVHSYLLLVRFSAVGIMRRNVVDI